MRFSGLKYWLFMMFKMFFGGVYIFSCFEIYFVFIVLVVKCLFFFLYGCMKIEEGR